ncbi:MAG TPA: cytochrome c [Vicinamibacterales bacterium]
MRVVFCASLIVLFGHVSAAQTPGPQPRPERSGEQIYRAACAACHAPDGKGQPVSVLGFEPPAAFPDFTDCPVSSAEPDLIWLAIIHMGGRVRGESHIMPAFADILSDGEIDSVVQYLHSLCAEPGWPRGELNFPRAFFTEKAFPENEVVFSVSTVPSHPRAVENRVDYEHRLGKRAQYEVGVPFNLQQGTAGQWSRGLGDVNLAYRYSFFDSLSHGSIGAAGAEVTLPTGKETEGLGGGVTIFEAFGMWNQALPRSSFVQFHTGFERPANHDIEKSSVFWRTAIGKNLAQNRWGRVWVPMVEVLGAKELDTAAVAEWDLVPQMQVTLSVFQHIKASVGVRIPMNERETRRKSAMAYLLWDWGDGGFFELWRAH